MSQIPGISSDAKAMMAFDAQKKSTATAYILWIFLGGLAGHKFYLGKPLIAIIQIVLLWLGILWIPAFIGIPMVFAAAIWLIVDLFRIPVLVRSQNMGLMDRISRGA